MRTYLVNMRKFYTSFKIGQKIVLYSLHLWWTHFYFGRSDPPNWSVVQNYSKLLIIHAWVTIPYYYVIYTIYVIKFMFILLTFILYFLPFQINRAAFTRIISIPSRLCLYRVQTRYLYRYLPAIYMQTVMVSLKSSVADPGSNAFLTPGPGSGIRNRFFSGSRISEYRIPDPKSIFLRG
jgi:hypothetical protein